MAEKDPKMGARMTAAFVSVGILLIVSAILVGVIGAVLSG